ncbi:MAG: acyl carrier protein, partial [Cytophagales bacterium]|nr:acyl carrier protein [Cytophagales bacterium]
KEQIKRELLAMLLPKLKLFKIAVEDVDENMSLIQQGILDSLNFIDFIMQVENKFDIMIEFDEMDATDFTTINQLCEIILTNKESN